MNKLQKEFDNLEENVIKTLKWFSLEYKYLSQLDEELKKIEIGEGFSSKDLCKKSYKKIKRTWYYIKKAERRSERDIEEVINLLKSGIGVTSNFFTSKQKLEIFSGKLLKAFDLYAGDFKKELACLAVAFRKKSMMIFWKNKKMDQNIIKTAKNIDQYISDLIKWDQAVVLTLKELEKIIEEKKIEEYRNLKKTNMSGTIPKSRDYDSEGVGEMRLKQLKDNAIEGIGKSTTKEQVEAIKKIFTDPKLKQSYHDKIELAAREGNFTSLECIFQELNIYYANKGLIKSSWVTKKWGDYGSMDLGRPLNYYVSIHLSLLRNLKNLKGKKFIHLGSGNTIYCDFLRRFYGVKTYALDVDKGYLQRAKKLGSKVGRLLGKLEWKHIKKNSVDVFLSDHFLYCDFGELNYSDEQDIFHHIYKFLKVGGIFIITKSYFSNRDLGSRFSSGRKWDFDLVDELYDCKILKKII
jgi:hypothetical protein